MKTIIITLLLSLFVTATTFAEPTKVYMIGNSLTDEVKYDDWINLCKDGGIEALYARKMIPGAPIQWHKDHPTDGFLTSPYKHPEEAFKNFPWDVLTLQPFRSGEAEPALYYTNLLWATNPNARVFVYAQWPGKGVEPDWLAAWKKIREENYLPVLASLRATPKGSQSFMIPTGWAMERLHKKAQLGIVPGITSAWDLYSDGVHVSNIGSYLVGLSFYSTIFGKSPIGLPVGGYQGKKGTDADYFDINPELAKVLQETVWEAVTGMSESGVTTAANQPPAITLPGLLPAVERGPYSVSLDAAFGKPPYTFALASGSLPSGMDLSPDGTFKGTPASQGETKFSVKVTDQANQSSSRDFLLKVVADTSPVITTGSIPPLQQGAFVNLDLKADSGNPPYHWSVADGKLPPGLVLGKDGHLSGSPAESGEYRFALEVTNNGGAKPKTDKKSYSGTISPADLEKVFFVRQATTEIKADANLDPAEGWDLKNELKKTYSGHPNNKVRWDAQWQKNKLWIAVEVTDDVVIAKDGYGQPRFKQDCLVFYFDGLNNREATYNFDDRRLAYGPVNQGLEDRAFNIGPFMAGDPKTQRTATGYIMKVSFDFNKLGIPLQNEDRKNRDTAYVGAVFGFDLENRDLDAENGEQSSLGWQGSAKNPDDPSGYGTMIIQAGK